MVSHMAGLEGMSAVDKKHVHQQQTTIVYDLLP